jgi:hypothetical protein
MDPVEIAIKAIPLIVGLLLIFIPPMLLRSRTESLADDALDKYITKKGNPQEDNAIRKTWIGNLDYLMNWRDLVTAILISLFTWEFAAVEKIGSTQPIVKAVAIVVIAAIIPGLMLGALGLANKWDLKTMQSKAQYRAIFVFLVMPWYIAAIIFTYVIPT